MFRSRTALSKFLRGVCLAGAIAAGQSHGALAQQNVTETMQASSRGLDLTTAQGEQELRRRVRVAAYHVCGVDDGSVSLQNDGFLQCVSSAMRDARPQIRTLVTTARNKSKYAAGSANRAVGPSP